MWHELKNYVRGIKPRSEKEFVKVICYFWEKILTPEKCRSYIDHVKKVFPHVILNNGYATPF